MMKKVKLKKLNNTIRKPIINLKMLKLNLKWT